MTAGWYPRVVAVLDRQALTPHVWGQSDCLCDVADVVKEMTGIDRAARYRGRYSSYDQALALLRADGFAEPIDLIRKYCIEIPVIDACDGDIGAITTEDGTLGFGIFIRDEFRVKAEHGQGRLRRSRAQIAFKVA